MDAKNFLDQLLGSAKEWSEKGQDVAEQKLGIPESGDQRDAMLSGMGKGALAAGALALLLGTGTGRKLTGSAIKIGGLAALGTVAYKAYQNWQAQAGSQAPAAGTPISELEGPQAQDRSELLIDAMIMAANADGHIDAEERRKIQDQLQNLGLEGDVSDYLEKRLREPLSIADIAARSDSPEANAELYLVSRLMIDSSNPAEATYLASLIEALHLSPELVAELEAQAGDL